MIEESNILECPRCKYLISHDEFMQHKANHQCLRCGCYRLSDFVASDLLRKAQEKCTK